MSGDSPGDFTPYPAWAAEGSRVAIIQCLKCGAAVLIGGPPDFDGPEVHRQWHRSLEALS